MRAHGQLTAIPRDDEGLMAPTVYYEVARAQLAEQLGRIDQLDAKVATLYATSSALLAVFAALVSLMALPPAIRVPIVILLGVAIAAYLWLQWTLYQAYQVKTWDMRPNWDDLQAHCAAYDETTMQRWVASECLTSLRTNEPLLNRKAMYVRRALVTLPAEVTLLALAAALILLAR